MNEVIQAIVSRRSCKDFKEDMIPLEAIDQIVTAGLYAASGMGKQSPKVIVVTDRKTRDHLSELNSKYDKMHRPDPFYGAPVVLCVVGPKDVPTGTEDGSLVLGNMMLAAHSLGIGSCWIHRAKEVFSDEDGVAVLRSVGLDENFVGIGHCVLGYPAGISQTPLPRKEGRVFRI